MCRSQSLLRLVLAVVMAASTQGFLFVQASFVANQAWIAETLCVNRDRPEVDCNGECVRMKRHGEHHDHGHAPAPPAELTLALSVRPLVAEPVRLAAPESEAAPPAPTATLAFAPGAPSDVFRPPRHT